MRSRRHSKGWHYIMPSIDPPLAVMCITSRIPLPSSLESLRDRVQELEEAESKLHRAEAQIQVVDAQTRSKL